MNLGVLLSRKWLQFNVRVLLCVMLICAYAFWRYGKHYRYEQSFIVSNYWDLESGENVKWRVPTGSQTYATPVVAGGKVFLCTNNGAGYLTRFPSTVDLGVLLCFSTEGKFLWQHSNEKLKTGRVHDWPLQGATTDPLVRGDRLWYVTNRCEVICLDTEGFYDDENDGPHRNEVRGLHEADVVWTFDMMNRLGVSPHNMSHSSAVTDGTRLFVGTSNGIDESHLNLPAPDAPSFIALDLQTGELLWSDNSPGQNILHGQWGSPVYGVLGGTPQVIFPGGDGWLYSFDPAGDGQGNSKLLWKFDCNPKTSKWMLGGRGTRNNLVAGPVIHDGLVYQVVGQDPEHGEGEGRLWCLDPTKRGDVSPELVFNKANPTVPIAHRRIQACDPAQGDFVRPNPNSAAVWQYAGADLNGDGRMQFEEEMHRGLSRVAIKNDFLFVTDFSGLFLCLDVRTGRPHWTYDMLSACWSSPTVAGEYVYVGDEDGDVAIFVLSADPAVAMPRGRPVAEINVGSSVYSTLVAADNVLYIASRSELIAIEEGARFRGGRRPGRGAR